MNNKRLRTIIRLHIKLATLALMCQRIAVSTLISAICVFLLVGCAVEEPWGNPVSDPSEASRVEGILKSLAKDHTPGYRLAPAPDRGRWADVDAAVNAAVGEDYLEDGIENGVEMGILQKIEHDWGVVFKLKTIEGWPVTMTIRKVEGEEVYQASAKVSHFPDLPDRQLRAKKLLAAFDKMMQAFGRKRVLVPKDS